MSSPPPPPPSPSPPPPPGWPSSSLPPPTRPAFVPSGPVTRSGLAVASLVLGIVGIPLFVLALPSLLAVVFGGIGLRQTADGRRQGRGLAIAGLVLGVIGLGLAILFWVWAVVSGDCRWEGGELICES